VSERVTTEEGTFLYLLKKNVVQLRLVYLKSRKQNLYPVLSQMGNDLEEQVLRTPRKSG